MAQLTKQALQVENNQSFPNNNVGAITPQVLRDYNTDVIDSTVNQTTYTSNSGSWNQSISALNTFTASQQPSFTALNAFTASQLTINSGYNSATQSLSASITTLNNEVDAIQTWTSSINEIRDDGVLQGYSTRFYFNGLVSASIVPNVNGAIANVTIEQDGTKLNTGSFNSYTASNDTKWSTLGAQTGSYVTSSITGSSLISASASGSTITFTKGNGSQFGVVVTATADSIAWDNVTGKPSGLVSGSSQVVDILTSVNSFTQSQNTKDSTLATYTGSVDTKFSTIGSASGSWVNTSLNTFSASQETKNSTLATYTGSNDTKWNTLGGQTGSYVTSAITGSSLVTASFSGNTLTFTKGNGTTFGVVIPDVSGSTINTGSLMVTGSVVGNVLTFTKGDASQFTLTVATGSGGGGTIATGSFATTGSNVFVGDQTITGSVNISGGEHLFVRRATAGAEQDLRLGATDNGNNFAFIVTGSGTNPGQQVWGINTAGGIWSYTIVCTK